MPPTTGLPAIPCPAVYTVTPAAILRGFAAMADDAVSTSAQTARSVLKLFMYIVPPFNNRNYTIFSVVWAMGNIKHHTGNSSLSSQLLPTTTATPTGCYSSVETLSETLFVSVLRSGFSALRSGFSVPRSRQYRAEVFQ